MRSLLVDWTSLKRCLEKSDGAPRKGAIYRAPGMGLGLGLLCIIKRYVGYCCERKAIKEKAGRCKQDVSGDHSGYWPWVRFITHCIDTVDTIVKEKVIKMNVLKTVHTGLRGDSASMAHLFYWRD